MKFCKRCGNKLNENVKFCGKCGLENEFKKLENVKVQQEENSQEQIFKHEEVINLKEVNLQKEKIQVNLQKDKMKVEKENIKIPKKKSSKGMIIGGIVVGVVAIGGALGYFLYDDILYKKYQNDIEATSSISEKFIYYDKIAKLEKFDLVQEDIIKLLKKDSNNIGYLKRMENIKDGEKNKISVEVLKGAAIEKYDKGDYEEAKKLLEEASKFGYNLNDTLYTNIVMKLDENTNNGQGESVNTGVISETEDMLFPESGLRYLSEDELRIYSKEELAIARNEIYARHGYVFRQEPFKSYFNEKDWYAPDYSFKGSDSELNDCEVQNIQLLLRLEKER